ncbi:hypothetical protein, partial [Pontibacter vulgaris]|uniref:hypothetical protein n=1 Tax=Pontibacter vulgaris TaxID=2905679 RepID=UPI001FA74AEE
MNNKPIINVYGIKIAKAQSSLILLALPFLVSFSVMGQCPPVSTLPCDQVQVALPFNLSFSAGVAGTLADKNGSGTGFTMVDAYSGTRHAEDGSPSNAEVPGYEPSKLTLSSGTLKLVTNKGIASTTSNNQINSLGVKVDSRNRLQAEVT